MWFSLGEKHWHGASPTTAMTHIAIQEKRNGRVVDWMEQVTATNTASELMEKKHASRYR